MKHLYCFILIAFSSLFLTFAGNVHAAENDHDIEAERMALYKKTEAVTLIPWYYLAAIDQYERNTHANTDDKLISIDIPILKWFGAGNSIHSQNPSIINLFQGIGKDGNGDEQADPDNPEDVLFSMAHIIGASGFTEDDIKRGIWRYYKRVLAVQTIKNTAKVFKQFDDIALTNRDFPVDTDYNYSYQNTWGDTRGFGGLRIHEGTDIFADHGTPVHATTYGVIELKGWNKFGGWRIGIRDTHNVYHYYAHLSHYQNGTEVGRIVKPGDTIGNVGSTGYGPPGTTGKFPPHLHYGMYKDNGKQESSFDPYPYLKKWERIEN